jgi:hypothetical protein
MVDSITPSDSMIAKMMMTVGEDPMFNVGFKP